MPDVTTGPRPFADLQKEFCATGVQNDFEVRSRGRPKMSEIESKEKDACLASFGKRFKELREAQGLTLQEASDAAGIASARKLSQYEIKCYPPGWILLALAPIYKVSAKYMAALKLSNSDPYMFAALSNGKTLDRFCHKKKV